MKCNDVKEKLIPFINNELDYQQMDSINIHINTCKDCKKIYEFTKNSLLTINKDKRSDSNPFFYQSVMTKMENKHETKKISISQNILKYSAAAMLSIISIVGGSYIGSFGAEIIDKSVISDSSSQYEIMDVANNDIDLFKDL
ncbi:MAG: hypothetical protein DRI86_13280 [Bacteroidetes bacterium]|nr:MAG: hypothetical protein DRI86_13280 [Bacteroidota bacterium]